jgi:hypothetical protein
VSVASAARPRLASRWQSFEAWVGTRASAATLFGLALVVYGIESIVLPAYAGRDMARYLQAFVQLGYHVPVYPAVLTSRGPLAILGVGVPLEIGGWAAELWLALLFALSIVAWARVAFFFGRRAALLTSVLLLVYPGYGILFHQLASDSLFAATFAGWALLMTKATVQPSIRAFLFAGLATGVLVLVRPDNEVLIVMSLVPLLLRGPWRERLSWVASFFVAAVVVSQVWTAFAEWRWGAVVSLKPSSLLIGIAVVLIPFLLRPPWRLRVAAALGVLAVVFLSVKGWPGESPTAYVRLKSQALTSQFMYRTFELDKIMSPDNGPASRKVAGVVQRDLLTQEPYRSYGVTVHEFFASGSDRVFGDMTDVVPGNELASATREAIDQHTGTFVRSIGHTIWQQIALRRVYAPPQVRTANAPVASQRSQPTQQTSGSIVVNGHRLPRPTEGQPIPASAIGPLLWTPGGQEREVWTSPTQHHTVFSDSRDQRRADRFYAQTDRLASRIPTRNGDDVLVHRLNQTSHVFPPLLVWLVLGLIAFVLRLPERAFAALVPMVGGVIVILATAAVAPAVAEYAVPVSPAFLTFAAVGFVGRSRAAERGLPASRRAAAHSATWFAGIAVGVAAAVWTVKVYYDGIKGYIDGAGAQHDLAVFLGAAGKVLHGSSPYVFQGDRTFAYPPFLAYVVAPLHPLSSSTAALVWMLLSLVVIALALWLLELRDWRCYALVGMFPFTRSAIDLGTIEPLLLLALAVAWRWRERLLQPAAGVGLAIVMKLFLWPLVIWLALMRRMRAAALSVGIAIALAFVSWAAISFAGIGHYPSVLRRLADHESSSSYSVLALGVRAHLPLLAARIASVLVTIALLAAAALVARDERRSPKNRDVAVLTLTLAAALALSPIVWVHYFLLLLVPLVLARPRLSPLWLVPFLYYPLGEAAWPAGNARSLGLALVATLIILGAPFVGDGAPLRLSPWSKIRSGT